MFVYILICTYINISRTSRPTGLMDLSTLHGLNYRTGLVVITISTHIIFHRCILYQFILYMFEKQIESTVHIYIHNISI